MKILGIEADNPFSLFLILILLLAANGTFDHKAVAETEGEDSAGALQKSTKKSIWQTRPSTPLFQRRQGTRLFANLNSPMRRLQISRNSALPFAKVMPLGR